MVAALSRCLGSAAFLIAADGARVGKKHQRNPTKFIAGVPVVNYDQAYQGESSLSESMDSEAEWVLVVDKGTSDAQIKTMCGAAPHGCRFTGHPSAGGVPFLELRGTESDLKAVIHSGAGAVQFVEPDQMVQMIPEIASTEAATWGLNKIGADKRARTGGQTTIFVLDTGVRVSHNDFSGRAAPAVDMSEGGLKECGSDLSCAADNQGHGTHCAGSAGGDTFGVAPGSQVRSIKVLSDQGSGSWSWSYGALDWLGESSIRPAVASMSLGGSGTQQAMKTAVDSAVNSGVVVVVAGGNENSNACGFSPAFVPSAITVGSTTSRDTRSSFSNYGSCTDIWAPGSDVVSASHTSDTGSVSFSGTSMACPHVAGAAALVLDADPQTKASDVVTELVSTSAKDQISGLKFGDTNALLYVGEGGAPQPVPTPAPPPGTWAVSGGGCTSDGNCIQSSNFPSNYGNNQECSIQLYGVSLSFDAFETESRYDVLTVNGQAYSGATGPASGTYTGYISWSSDYSVTKSGWKFCKA